MSYVKCAQSTVRVNTLVELLSTHIAKLFLSLLRPISRVPFTVLWWFLHSLSGSMRAYCSFCIMWVEFEDYRASYLLYWLFPIMPITRFFEKGGQNCPCFIHKSQGLILQKVKIDIKWTKNRWIALCSLSQAKKLENIIISESFNLSCLSDITKAFVYEQRVKFRQDKWNWVKLIYLVISLVIRIL